MRYHCENRKGLSLIFLFALASGLLGIIFVPGYLKIKDLSRQNRELEKKITEIKELNTRLTEERQALINDPVYLEKVARDKLGIVKKGEVVYKVVSPENNQ